MTKVTTNLRSEIFSDKDDSILICHCQVVEINSLNKDNMDNISKNIILSWQNIVQGGKHQL